MIWHICRPLVNPLPASQGGSPKPSPVRCLEHWLDYDFRTPRSAPHFTAHLVSNHHWAFAMVHAAIKRSKTRADHAAVGQTPRLFEVLPRCGFGVLQWIMERAPRKLGGGVRNE